MSAVDDMHEPCPVPAPFLATSRVLPTPVSMGTYALVGVLDPQAWLSLPLSTFGRVGVIELGR